ncbi:MAG: metal ABC transporter substrate-binding protein [Alphaproteobacteria bacterium]|nr:metal ABC transporter substrate-binding protein [Alphaproteobacteria bacterium]
MFKKIIVFCCLLSFFANKAHCEETKILSSILPLNSIVSKISNQKTNALLNGNYSVHHYSLKPSDLKQINDADIIFWGGKELEHFLVKPVQEKNNISFLKDNENPHFWLNIEKINNVINEIKVALTNINPNNKKIYEENSDNLKNKINEIIEKAKNDLIPYSNKPFIVGHDAFDDFEKALGIKNIGIISPDEHHEITPSNMIKLRKTIEQNQPICIFLETGTNPNKIMPLIEGYNVKLTYLDPMGISLNKDDENFYISLIQNLINNIKNCLNKL